MFARSKGGAKFWQGGGPMPLLPPSLKWSHLMLKPIRKSKHYSKHKLTLIVVPAWECKWLPLYYSSTKEHRAEIAASPRIEVGWPMIKVGRPRIEVERPRIEYYFFTVTFLSTTAFHSMLLTLEWSLQNYHSLTYWTKYCAIPDSWKTSLYTIVDSF